jgi:hypothetical protein
LLPLELGERAEQMNDEAAVGCARVQRLADAVQFPAFAFRSRHELQHVAQGAREPVQLDDDEARSSAPDNAAPG